MTTFQIYINIPYDKYTVYIDIKKNERAPGSMTLPLFALVLHSGDLADQLSCSL